MFFAELVNRPDLALTGSTPRQVTGRYGAGGHGVPASDPGSPARGSRSCRIMVREYV